MANSTDKAAKVPKKMEDFCTEAQYQKFLISQEMVIHFIKSGFKLPSWFVFYEDGFMLEPLTSGVQEVYGGNLENFFKENVIDVYKINNKHHEAVISGDQLNLENLVEFKLTSTAEGEGHIASNLGENVDYEKDSKA